MDVVNMTRGRYVAWNIGVLLVMVAISCGIVWLGIWYLLPLVLLNIVFLVAIKRARKRAEILKKLGVWNEEEKC